MKDDDRSRFNRIHWRTKMRATPVFILASPRSFTSVICAALGQHPQAYGVPELNLFVEPTVHDLWLRMSARLQFMMHGLLRTVAQLYSGEQTLDSIDMARRWLLRRLDRTTAEVYLELSEKAAPRHIVDKSPAYTADAAILKRIDAAFPDARFLHITRHPYAQGESLMRLPSLAMATGSIDFSTQPPTIDPQIGWLRGQSNIVKFLETLPASRHLHLRGEEFVANPRQSASALCEWLGWARDDAALECMLHPERSPYASYGPHGTHLGNDPGFLKSPALKVGAVKLPPLDAPLAWRADGAGFQPGVLELAHRFGYA